MIFIFTETRRKWWNKFKHSPVDVKKMAAVKLCVR